MQQAIRAGTLIAKRPEYSCLKWRSRSASILRWNGNYIASRKKQDTKQNARGFTKWNRFSIFFHCQTQRLICNKFMLKYPTTPWACRYTTLWNVNVRELATIWKCIVIVNDKSQDSIYRHLKELNTAYFTRQIFWNSFFSSLTRHFAALTPWTWRFLNIDISHGSVATRLRRGGIFKHSCCKFTAESNSKRISTRSSAIAEGPRDASCHLKFANCHATVQKLLVRQVLNKSKLWS